MDKHKRYLGFALAFFALSGLGVWAWRALHPVENKAGGTAVSDAKVVVYYFHTNYRCVTCNKFESFTRAELEAGFSRQMKDGTLAYQVVNVEQAGNEHFVQDYGLRTKSIVLAVPGEKGRWKNLERIWDEVGSEAGFKRYIQTELEAFLRGNP